MSLDAALLQPEPGPGKFEDPDWTAKREPRASVRLERLETLWINTGTLCNITCRNCYIESSPSNDRLVYMTAAEAAAYFDEIEAQGFGTREIGFTGGEPFMNPQLLDMVRDALARGFEVLVLSNAMQPMQRPRVKRALVDLGKRFGGRLTIRVSLDHYTQACTRPSAGRAAGPVRSPGSTGWRATDCGSRSPAAPAGTRTRRARGGATPGSSRTTAGRSMPPIRASSCCCRRWTASTTCPRSPPAAGPS